MDFKKWSRADKNELANALQSLTDNIHPLRRVGDFAERLKALKTTIKKMEDKYHV